MIRLDLISHDQPGIDWLQGLKRYASVPDDSQDTLLDSLLVRACTVVQEYADASLLACSFRLSVSGCDSQEIRLYQTVSTVTRVYDGSGNDIGYTMSGRCLKLSAPAGDLTVEYDTVPDQASVDMLLPVAIRYATALYDGQDNTELTKIISEIC